MSRLRKPLVDLTRSVNRLLQRKQWRRAIVAIESMPRASRTFDLWWNHGWALGKLEDWNAAVRSLAVAVRAKPTDAIGHWALGVAHSEAGHPKLAERHHLLALRFKDSSLARLTLAVHYMERGKFASAERIHREGIALRPRSRRRLKQYADFLWDVGRRDEARQVYRRARELPKEGTNKKGAR